MSDVDAFYGELLSSRAQLGVLYSYSGYTAQAIEKGRALGISCCRLYQGSGPELPQILSVSAYCCRPRFTIALDSKYPMEMSTTTWRDIFSMPVLGRTGPMQTLDELADIYHRAEKESVAEIRAGSEFPKPFARAVTIARTGAAENVQVHINGQWTFYQAKVEAFWFNGSYEFTSGGFMGELATPPIDRMSTEPGPGWEALDREPIFRPACILCVLSGGNATEALLTVSECTVVSPTARQLRSPPESRPNGRRRCPTT